MTLKECMHMSHVTCTMHHAPCSGNCNGGLSGWQQQQYAQAAGPGMPMPMPMGGFNMNGLNGLNGLTGMGNMGGQPSQSMSMPLPYGNW